MTSAAPIAAARVHLPIAAGPARSDRRSGLLAALLVEQRTLTAVDEFARAHDERPAAAQARHYRDLLPLEAPKAGQQYAFDVNLDQCTGCKACVTACHSLNGLDEGEVWRSVGLLHGGTPEAPVQQSVTTACHHCLDPACMTGCPVLAYEKHPVTGIVKHLDDQCIGCQYCVLMCPYEAPKYNAERGIVRKCDMCSDRLAHDEAPACVQACPSAAIRITLIDTAQTVEESEVDGFLPGAPAPGDTLPTTRYRTEKALPRNLLPADYYAVSPEHSHPPLVVMLVLTQLSVGAVAQNLLVKRMLGAGATPELGASNAVFALVLGLSALGASILHLGRPLYAFRALLGMKTSWLSREIAGFSLFAILAGLHALSFWAGPALEPLRGPLEIAVALSGSLGLACSVMVYAATRRASWRGPVTGFDFTTTAIILGAATVAMVSAIAGRGQPAGAVEGAIRALGAVLCAATALKLLAELAGLRHLAGRHHSPAKRSAILRTGDLKSTTLWRFACGLAGGLVLPAIGLAATQGGANGRGLVIGWTVGAFLLCLAGELLGRYLFFAAAPAPRMPGGVG